MVVCNPQSIFCHTTFTPGSFWSRRRSVVRHTTLQFQLAMLKKTGRYDAFDLKWHPSYSDPPNIWPVPNHLFWDSDVAKWVEGACYFLAQEEDEEMMSTVEDLVKKIRGAQQEDGYLNVHFTVVEPGRRWTNLRDLHELYNGGHLIEASLIHHQIFRNNELLDPLLKYVELIHGAFGPASDQIRGYPGHPEIELALIRLYKATNNQKALNLARYFLQERGNLHGVDGKHFYDVEAAKRGDRPNETPDYYPKSRSYWYQQAHKPILEQGTIEGHSVRAMYLLTAVADLSIVDRDGFGKKYEPALTKLWDNMVDRKMYLTGGIGAMEQWEGFGIDYFLPQSTDEGGCYAETCAAIGVMMLAERMLQLHLDRKYADILELCLFNSVLTGMSLNGKAFTYVNQLASSPSHPSERHEWFDCACCPPNVARTLGYLGGYIWTFAETEPNTVDINVHLYTSATLEFESRGRKIQLEQKTEYPWKGDIAFHLLLITMPATDSDPSVPAEHRDLDITIRLRIPAWASSDYILTPDPAGNRPPLATKNGYLALPASYLRRNPQFTLSFAPSLKPRLISPHPYTNQRVAAVARGPIVYCVEGADHPWVDDHFKSLIFDTSASSLIEVDAVIPIPVPVPVPSPVVADPCVVVETNASSSNVVVDDDDKIKGDESYQAYETYVAVEAKAAGNFLKRDVVDGGGPDAGNGKVMVVERGRKVDLRFVPYYLRANRDGNDNGNANANGKWKGMMRVGLRVGEMVEM